MKCNRDRQGGSNHSFPRGWCPDRDRIATGAFYEVASFSRRGHEAFIAGQLRPMHEVDATAPHQQPSAGLKQDPSLTKNQQRGAE
jgi:hypothetical protein